MKHRNGLSMVDLCLVMSLGVLASCIEVVDLGTLQDGSAAPPVLFPQDGEALPDASLVAPAALESGSDASDELADANPLGDSQDIRPDL